MASAPRRRRLPPVYTGGGRGHNTPRTAFLAMPWRRNNGAPAGNSPAADSANKIKCGRAGGGILVWGGEQMGEWHRLVQLAMDWIDEAIQAGDDDALTLEHLAGRMGYSAYHATRVFRRMAGQSLRDYLRLRRLAFALLEVRDTTAPMLEIAVKYGFSSQAAFTRAFKAAYGTAPGAYRAHPAPVVLRTKIHPLDYYQIQTKGAGMEKPNGTIRVYHTRVPAHSFLHVKNYQSSGYWDFWKRQDDIPGQDCDTICGILDGVKGKLDGEEGVIGKFSGQIMGYPREADGRIPEAYGVRLPAGWPGPIPDGMLLLAVPQGEYVVFEHGPFSFSAQGGAVFDALERAIAAYRYEDTGYLPDNAPGRIAYYYHDPERYIKRLLPVKKG